MSGRWVIVLCGLTACWLATTAHANAIQLTQDTFEQETKQHTWLVKFYAPWCGHCKKLAPVFDGLSSHPNIQNTDIRIGKVDCTTNQQLCERFDVQSYPTVKVIHEGKSYDYAGRRDADAFVQYVTGGYKSEPSERVVSAEEFVKMRAQHAAEQAAMAKSSEVVGITTTSFESLVVKGDHPWILKFYAPWCGHCKRLAPTWDQLSVKLKESGSTTKVGKIDCTVHRRVCSRFGVQGFPTIFYVKDGQVFKYEGKRQLNSLVDFVQAGHNQVEPTGPIPSERFFSKVFDGMLEWASGHTVSAILVLILFIAVFVALMVALLDYCLGDDERVVSPASAHKKEE